MDTYATQIARRSAANSLSTKLAGAGFRLLPRVPAVITYPILRRIEASYRPPKALAAEFAIEDARHGSARVVWLQAAQRHRGVVVFLHGGSYIIGPGRNQWGWLAEIQRRTQLAVASVIYRMPPDDPFPAALDDALAAIRGMSEAGQLQDGPWVLAGDSAGGGLAITTQRILLNEQTAKPSGLVLTAPWVDLTLTNPELSDSQRTDPLLHTGWLLWAARLYAGGVPLDDPRLSPINGSFAGFPPVHLDVGTRDLFLPDVRRVRDELRAAGVEVDYLEQEGGVHDFAHLVRTPEGRRATETQADWTSGASLKLDVSGCRGGRRSPRSRSRGP